MLRFPLGAIGLAVVVVSACGDDRGSETEDSTSAGTTAITGTTSSASTNGETDPGSTAGETSAGETAATATGDTTGESTASETGTTGSVSACEQFPELVYAYRDAHPGNGGKDWDINAKSDAELAGDPLAQQILAYCGPDQRPVIPALAWEYGGNDHQWIQPSDSAWFYCVYVPINPGTEHWNFDENAQLVTADMSIGCPEMNPCKDDVGADQVLNCLGDDSNIEILVDTMSLNDGIPAGYDLSEAGTDVYLLQEDGSRVFVINVP